MLEKHREYLALAEVDQEPGLAVVVKKIRKAFRIAKINLEG